MFGKKYTWQKISDALTLADREIRQVDWNDRKICIVRVKEDLYACADECPHAGFSLSEGYIDNRGHIVCPLHSLGFNLQNGLDANKEGYRLKVFPVKVQSDGVYIGISK